MIIPLNSTCCVWHPTSSAGGVEWQPRGSLCHDRTEWVWKGCGSGTWARKGRLGITLVPNICRTPTITEVSGMNGWRVMRKRQARTQTFLAWIDRTLVNTHTILVLFHTYSNYKRRFWDTVTYDLHDLFCKAFYEPTVRGGELSSKESSYSLTPHLVITD